MMIAAAALSLPPSHAMFEKGNDRATCYKHCRYHWIGYSAMVAKKIYL
jgi:hypothetical protein